MATEAPAGLEAPTLAQELATAAPVKAPDVKEAPAATKAEQAGKKDKKSEKGKKSKKGKQPSAPEGAEVEPSIAAHPRAARAVARAKGWGGLFGFFLGGYLSLPTATPAAAGLRALVAGIVCYVVVWAGAQFAWRRLVIIEIKAREQQLLAAAQATAARGEQSVAGVGRRAGARPGA
jgi:hypothetical protein